MSDDLKTKTRSNRLYLCSPVNALVEGVYEERIPIATIKEHGDFGLGTFDQLDGELILLDGEAYQVTSDGRVSIVQDEAMTPFACVTFFEPLSQDALDGELSYPAFLDWLTGLLPSPNLFYAIRIDGEFAHVRTRSVPRQACFRPLVQVAQEQPEFDFENVTGTLVSFFTPSFMSSINVPGLHLHFISADRTMGGHLLECQPRRVRAGVQFLKTMELELPMTLDYLTLEFKRDAQRDLDKAEK